MPAVIFLISNGEKELESGVTRKRYSYERWTIASNEEAT